MSFNRYAMAARSTQSAPGSGAVAFDDLPGEIRNEIYKLALVNRLPIKVQRRVVPTAKPKKPFGFSTHPPVYKFESTTIMLVGKKKRRVPVNKVLDICLLLVGRNVNYEASQVLLGENRFVFESAATVNSFCDMLGPSKVFLRDVEIKGKEFSETNELQIRALACMANPKRIAIAAQPFCGMAFRASCTWRLIRAIVTRKGSHAFGKSGKRFVRFVEPSEEEQLERFNAFIFDVSGHSNVEGEKWDGVTVEDAT